MPYVERRVFFGRVGMGQPLIDHLKGFSQLAERYGLPWNARILSDFNSGRTDRIVMEVQVEHAQDLLREGEAFSDPEAGKAFMEWNDRLNELIHYAEVEYWRVQ